MNPWEQLELEYARRLRTSSREQRKTLYAEAYGEVSKLRMAAFTSTDPEQRTAGTSKALVAMLARLCRPSDEVLEIGCGRGYTCWQLAPRVRRITGTDVSEPSLAEARALLAQKGVANARLVNAGGDELTRHFAPASFDLAISIEVYEHLHPEDGRQHLREVSRVLKPRGAYVIVTPNRLNGPSDVTQQVHPEATEPLGFHLNETTNRELIRELRSAGFRQFRSVCSLASRVSWLPDLWYPARVSCGVEALYPALKKIGLGRAADRFLGITLLAVKGGE